ncbi:2641_t:CDS:2, partial [Dentiscutata erythropus]
MKFLSISSLFIFVLVTFNFVSAQQLPQNISSTCQQEILKLAGSSDLNSCASFTKLAQLQNTTNPQQALDTYCAAPKCSDNTTSADATELKTQCATDLSVNDPNVIAIKQIFVFNSPIKDALCFKSSSGGYCYLDPNSNSIMGYISGLNATTPTDINCTDCNKAILNIFYNYIKANPASASDLTIDPTSFQTLVTSKCNSSFLDGAVPTPTSSSSPTAKSGSISMHATSFIGFT